MEELSCSCVGRERHGRARVNELSPDSPQELQDISNTRGQLLATLHQLVPASAADRWKHCNGDQNEKESPR